MPILPPVTHRSTQITRVGARALWQLARGRHARISTVTQALFAGFKLPVRVLDAERIPEGTPFVLILNHYENPRVAAWWGALLVDRIVTSRRTREPREMRWVMAQEWAYPSGLGRYIKQPASRLLFARVSQVYGTIRVPPILDGDPTRGQGVEGVRHALALTRGPLPQLVAIAPEGHAGPRGQLKEPPPGAGLFLLLLTHDTIPCLPVGWYADERDSITIRFGSPFHLSVPRSKDREARDRAAATVAMLAIGRLLPEYLWGAYRDRLGQ